MNRISKHLWMAAFVATALLGLGATPAHATGVLCSYSGYSQSDGEGGYHAERDVSCLADSGSGCLLYERHDEWDSDTGHSGDTDGICLKSLVAS